MQQPLSLDLIRHFARCVSIKKEHNAPHTFVDTRKRETIELMYAAYARPCTQSVVNLFVHLKQIEDMPRDLFICVVCLMSEVHVEECALIYEQFYWHRIVPHISYLARHIKFIHEHLRFSFCSRVLGYTQFLSCLTLYGVVNWHLRCICYVACPQKHTLHSFLPICPRNYNRAMSSSLCLARTRTHIPIRIAHHLFEYLLLKDLCKCMLVCRSWSSALYGTTLGYIMRSERVYWDVAMEETRETMSQYSRILSKMSHNKKMRRLTIVNASYLLNHISAVNHFLVQSLTHLALCGMNDSLSKKVVALTQLVHLKVPYTFGAHYAKLVHLCTMHLLDVDQTFFLSCVPRTVTCLTLVFTPTTTHLIAQTTRISLHKIAIQCEFACNALLDFVECTDISVRSMRYEQDIRLLKQENVRKLEWIAPCTLCSKHFCGFTKLEHLSVNYLYLSGNCDLHLASLRYLKCILSEDCVTFPAHLESCEFDFPAFLQDHHTWMTRVLERCMMRGVRHIEIWGPPLMLNEIEFYLIKVLTATVKINGIRF